MADLKKENTDRIPAVELHEIVAGEECLKIVRQVTQAELERLERLGKIIDRRERRD